MYIYTCVYVFVYICTCVYVFVYVYTRVYVFTCVPIRIHTHIYIYLCMYTHVYMYLCIHMCICLRLPRRASSGCPAVLLWPVISNGWGSTRLHETGARALSQNHITSGSFSTSIKVSIWCRPLNGRVKGRSRSQIMLPSLIDGPPLRGAPVRLPVEVIHKLCLIQLYFYPNNKMYLSKMQNIHI